MHRAHLLYGLGLVCLSRFIIEQYAYTSMPSDTSIYMPYTHVYKCLYACVHAYIVRVFKHICLRARASLGVPVPWHTSPSILLVQPPPNSISTEADGHIWPLMVGLMSVQKEDQVKTKGPGQPWAIGLGTDHGPV